jgi:hypothetical protein
VLHSGDGAQMFAADAGKLGNFVFGENFLGGLDGDHFSAAFVRLVFEFSRSFSSHTAGQSAIFEIAATKLQQDCDCIRIS